MTGRLFALAVLAALGGCGGDQRSATNQDGAAVEPAPVGADVGTTGNDATATAVNDSAANPGAHP